MVPKSNTYKNVHGIENLYIAGVSWGWANDKSRAQGVGWIWECDTKSMRI